MTGAGFTLAIGGPTATGKTMLAVELAHRLGAELLNADSRQVARRLRVGTAAPTAAELRGVPCHLLDLCEPGPPFTVADWLRRATTCLTVLDAQAVPAIAVGGTGQYLRALREGWDFGGLAPARASRVELTRAASTADGLARLAAELRQRDPDGAADVDLANPRRVVRALELVRASGGPLTASRRRLGGRPLALVILDADRKLHALALENRMNAMFETGAIVAEARAELERGTAPAALARCGIGYAEAVAILEGRADVSSARSTALQRTRRYVKAQRTWFRSEPAILRVERRAGMSSADLAEAVLPSLATPGGWPR